MYIFGRGGRHLPERIGKHSGRRLSSSLRLDSTKPPTKRSAATEADSHKTPIQCISQCFNQTYHKTLIKCIFLAGEAGISLNVSASISGGASQDHLGYRVTSLTRNCSTLGPYSRPVPRALWWSQGGWWYLMSEISL